MRFPDTVTVLRPEGADEYGNADGSWSSPTPISGVGFMLAEKCLMPANADVKRGDRLVVAGRTYDVIGDPRRLRSPTKTVLTSVTVEPVRT